MKLFSNVRWGLRCPLICLAAVTSLPALVRAQAKIQGQVLNGTTGNVVPGQQVSLLVPRQGMQKVATARTDAGGHFVFSQSDIETKGFYLLEAVLDGVPYHAPVLFQSGAPVTTNLQVYEPTSSPGVLSVQLLLIGVRAIGSKAEVQEQFTVQNSSQPPRAFVDSKGTFRFHVSPSVAEPSVSVKGIMEMDLPQSVVRGKSAGDYVIHYPLKPGANVITVSYATDYTAERLQLDDAVPYRIQRAELYVMPSSLKVESANFKPSGRDAANNVEKLAADSLAASAPLQAGVSGPALPESSAGGAGGQSGSSSGEPQVKVVPTSITNLALPLLGCFFLILFWALGVRLGKEWPALKVKAKARPSSSGPATRKLSAKVEKLLNSLADLDELFAAGKLSEKDYWRERLELKARAVAALKKSSIPATEAYATRRAPR